MKTGDKVIVPAETSRNKRLWQRFTGNSYRDREVRRGNIRNSDIHRTMSGSLRKKGGVYHDFQLIAR